MQNPQTSRPRSQVLSGTIRREGVEGMAAAVRNFFDLEAAQLEPGETRCQIDFVAAGSVIAYLEDYPLRTHLRGELLGGRFGLALPVGGPPIKFSGEDMDHCRLASAMSGEEMDVFARGGLSQVVVLVDQSRLLDLAEAAGLPREVVRSLRPGRATMPLVAKPDAVAEFGRSFCDLLQRAAAGAFPLDQDGFEEWIYGRILSLVDVKDLPCGRPSAAVLVRRATEIAEARPGHVPITQICAALRVSPGTLEKSFKKVTGFTPHTFFLRRRLNRVRGLLLEADPGLARVTDIAATAGFGELGRFAVRYRQMFGEKPSETLRRTCTTLAVPGLKR